MQGMQEKLRQMDWYYLANNHSVTLFHSLFSQWSIDATGNQDMLKPANWLKIPELYQGQWYVATVDSK